MQIITHALEASDFGMRERESKQDVEALTLIHYIPELQDSSHGKEVGVQTHTHTEE